MNTKQAGILGATLFALTFASHTTKAASVVAFEESFETDGLAEGRYTLENPTDSGNGFFARKADLANGTRTTGGTLHGGWFWACRDLDKTGVAVNELEADEARLTTQAFSIAGLGDFELLLEVAQGEDAMEADNMLLIQFRIDGGEWESVGGFRGTGTDSPGRYFVGDENTVASLSEARLTNNFQTFSWKIARVGTTMQVRIKANLNGGTEEYAFDRIRIVADDALAVASLSLPAASFNEGTTTTLTVSLASAAPVAGVTTYLASSNTDELTVPESVSFAEGETSKEVPVTIVADNGFDGDQKVHIQVTGEGIAPNSLATTVVNVDAKPSLVLNEFMTSVPGSLEDDLIGDSNGDGIRNGSQDEFLEFVNTGTVDIDMSGWIASDDKGPRHVFPEGTILKPGRALVLFAGGNPVGLFGGAIVQKATAGNLGYGDTGDVIVLSSGGAEVLSVDYTSTFPSVYMGVTLSPDLTGSYVLHETVSPTKALFSPGTMIDGTPFGTFSNTLHLSLDKSTVAEDDATPIVGTVSLTSPAPTGGLEVQISTNGMYVSPGGNYMIADEVFIEVDSIVIPEGQTSGTFEISAHDDHMLDGDRSVLVFARNDDCVPSQATLTVTDSSVNYHNVVINEAMPSLANTGLDLNGNGTSEEAINDQFIEIVNNSGSPVNLSGWKLYSYGKSDTNGQVCVHIFPAGTKLAPAGSVVIFGGGDEATINANAATLTAGALAQISNSGGVGVNLTRGDDGIIRLENKHGYVVDSVEYDVTNADQGQSITRSPDMTGDFDALHIAASLPTFLAVSPGATVKGVAFSGNGPVVENAYEMMIGDYYRANADYYHGASFGWSYVTHWPFLYSFDTGSWMYVAAEVSGEDAIYFYAYSNRSWYYTDSTLYPWAWNFSLGAWEPLY